MFISFVDFNEFYRFHVSTKSEFYTVGLNRSIYTVAIS